MISVQNHLRLLNGNNIIQGSVFILFCFMMSCSGTKSLSDDAKKVKQTRPDNNGMVQKNKMKVDTVSWTEIDRTKDYNERIEDLELVKKDEYNVSLLFPFELEKNNPSDVSDSKHKLGQMANYYAGVKMALQKLEEEGVSLNVNVLDAESGSFDQKLQTCKNADVIIGPRSTEQLSVAANFGKINQIPVISPWKSGSKISRDNPFFIQLESGLKAHFDKIVEHAKAEFDDDQIFLLGRNTKKEDLTYMRYIQSVAAAINRDPGTKPFTEFYVNEDSLKLAEFAFDSIFLEDKTSAFILPNWSFLSDEDFVYNTARKLSGEKGLNNVVFYGMPILLESEKVKFDLYRGLNMRICRSSYVDRSAVTVKEFREDYFNMFGGFPSEEALEGFDMMMFIGRSLFNYGKNFQYFLDSYESSLLQTKFNIVKVFDQQDQEEFKDIQYFQNDHLYILSFENDKFELK